MGAFEICFTRGSGWAGESSQLFVKARRNPDVNLFPAHRAQTQDRAVLRLGPFPERVEEERYTLTDGVMRRVCFDVGGVLPVRAGDIDGDEQQFRLVNCPWAGCPDGRRL